MNAPISPVADIPTDVPLGLLVRAARILEVIRNAPINAPLFGMKWADISHVSSALDSYLEPYLAQPVNIAVDAANNPHTYSDGTVVTGGVTYPAFSPSAQVGEHLQGCPMAIPGNDKVWNCHCPAVKQGARASAAR